MSEDGHNELCQRAMAIAKLARDEDVASGDITSQLIDGDEPARFRLIARQGGVFAGRAIIEEVLRCFGNHIELRWADAASDGAKLEHPPIELATVYGPCKSILQAERVVLNFLQRLCGIATLTRAYVDSVVGTAARIFDTRKTVPGWRAMDKYAVRCGGGHNHRMGLYDAVLIKDNHLADVPARRLAGYVFDLLNRLDRLDRKPTFVEVEADSLEQFSQLLKVVGINVILLDNFAVDELGEAVSLRDAMNLTGQLALEASGGITLETVRSVAETGVDRIAVGAITHSVPALDLAMEKVTD